MSTRAHAVDRLLEALSPTLSAELERIINETKEDLEKDFQKRLDAALREAENAAAHPPWTPKVYIIGRV
jgi:hypothetical protein